LKNLGINLLKLGLFGHVENKKLDVIHHLSSLPLIYH
jgi:hypothetical protein